LVFAILEEFSCGDELLVEEKFLDAINVMLQSGATFIVQLV
jgi:hypothetical protein